MTSARRPGQRRREHLVGVAARPAAATFAAADDGHHALLVEAQELREPQLQPRRDPAGDLQRRARLAALDLAEHRRRDAGALREIAQREVHRLPQRLHARPDGRDGGVGSRRHYACTLSRTVSVAPTGHERAPFGTASAPRFPPGRPTSTSAGPLTAVSRTNPRQLCGPPASTFGRSAARSLEVMTERSASYPTRSCSAPGGTLGEAWLRGVLGGLEAGADAGLPRLRVPARHLGGLDRRRHARRRQAPRGRRARRPRVGARGGAARGDRRAGAARARGAKLGGAIGRGAARAGKAVATPFAPLALATTAPGRPARPRRRAEPRAAARAHARRRRRATSTRSARASTAGCGSPPSTARSGKRVMFGAPDEPRATVAEAVLASCAVPWIFAPVEIGGREYVDGGVWSPTNLDAVPAGRGTRVLCLIPTAGAALAPLRTASAAAAGYESMALRAKGADVHTIVPDGPSLEAIGPNLMDPSRRARSPPPATRRAAGSVGRPDARALPRGRIRRVERFYGELAPLVAADLAGRGIRGGGGRDRPPARGDVRTVLELGSGGGSNAFHLKDRYALTLSDLSAEMLAVSRAAEPRVRARPGRHAHAAARAHVRRRARPRRDRLHDHRGRPARGAGAPRSCTATASRCSCPTSSPRPSSPSTDHGGDGRRALPRVDLRPRPVRHLDGHRVRLRAARRATASAPSTRRTAPGLVRPRDAGCELLRGAGVSRG